MAFQSETAIQDLGDGIDTGIPMRSATDYYIADVLRGIARYEQSMQNMSGVTDIRPQLLGRAVVMKILDDDIRKQLLEALDKEIDTINASKGENDKKAFEVLIAIQNAHGQVYSYLDQFLGISKHLVIGKL